MTSLSSRYATRHRRRERANSPAFSAKTTRLTCRTAAAAASLGSMRQAGPSGVAHASRVLAIVVPPVDELDLVGPLQVFSAANRLTGRAVYSITVATTAKDLEVAGEGG